jgi:Replication protein C N-terminal domain
MESPKPTTPLCRRTLPLAHVATQIPAATWRNVLRAIRTARPGLSVPERPLASATLTRPSPKTRAHRLHEQLYLRTGVMPDPTLRRQLAPFVDAYVIDSQDSPHGERGPQKGRGGKSMRPAGFAFGPRAPSGRLASAHLREQAPSTPHRQGQGRQHKLYADAPRSNRRRHAGGTTPQIFLDPILVRAMRRLQWRSPKRTGGR